MNDDRYQLADFPLVSVIMAAYNAARFIGEAIESVIDQSYENWELVVVDDGSTDLTSTIIANYLNDTRIHCVRQKNGGQTSAKNRGLSLARGSLVAFLDADDSWHRDKLLLQLPLFKDPQVGVVYSDVQVMDQNGVWKDKEKLKLRRGWVTRPLIVDNFVPFGTAVVRLNLINEIGGFDQKLSMGIDWDLWLRLSTRCKFDFVDQKLQYYRVWSGQMSSNLAGRYSGAFEILSKFERSCDHGLAKADFRRARANCYSNMGRGLAARGLWREAWVSVGRAIHTLPYYPFAWRSLMRLVIDWLGRGQWKSTGIDAS